MVVTNEITLRDFEPWAGAVSRYETLTASQLDQLTFILEDLYPDGCTETQINDVLWFEEEWIAECLGFHSWEELEEANEDE